MVHRKRAAADIRACISEEVKSGFSPTGTREDCADLDNYYKDVGFDLGANNNAASAAEVIACEQAKFSGFVEVVMEGRCSARYTCIMHLFPPHILAHVVTNFTPSCAVCLHCLLRCLC